MKNLTNLLEDLCTYFCEKYGCTEIYEIHSFNNGHFLGKVHRLNIDKQPKFSELCVVLGKDFIALTAKKPNQSSIERITDEIISAGADTFGAQDSLIIYPADRARGVACIMFHPGEEFTSSFKIEFMSKLNELYFSGEYSFEKNKESVENS